MYYYRLQINWVFQKKKCHLLLQEYTAEIERLRRDLAATRDKNGVYLAYDNYTQMISQLEHQEQEMSQMLAHMKALKEEMDKKEASSDTHGYNTAWSVRGQLMLLKNMSPQSSGSKNKLNKKQA
jgi:hypothetical protein